MPEPEPVPPPVDPLSTRPAGFGQASTRPGDLRSSVFGSSVLGQLDAQAQASRESGAGSAFDVCHVGVVLRAVLLVQAVMALGVLYTAASWNEWVGQLSRGSIMSLWAVVAWLTLSCALKRWLAHLPTAAQWGAAMTLGALCAALALLAAHLRLAAVADILAIASALCGLGAFLGVAAFTIRHAKRLPSRRRLS